MWLHTLQIGRLDWEIVKVYWVFLQQRNAAFWIVG